MNTKKAPTVLFEYMIALALVLNCQSIWTASPVFSSSLFYFNLLLIGVGSLGILILKKLSIKHLYVFIFTLLYLSIYYFVTPVNKNAYLGLILVIYTLLLVMLCDSTEIQNILLAYSNLVMIVAVISLFFWFFGTLMHVISPTGDIISTWSNTGQAVSQRSFFNVYFETQMDASSFLRNSSIFTESPMAGFNFSTALLINLFIKQRSNLINFLILSIAVLSTHSTAAYLVLFSAVFYLLYFNSKKDLRQLAYYFSLVIIPVMAFVIFGMLQNKFATMSGGLRSDDYKVGIAVWKDYPFFGCGFNNDQLIQTYMNSWRSINIGFSNSITYVLATGGIFLFGIYIVPFCLGIVSSIKRGNIKLLFFCFSVFISWAVLIVPYNYIIVTILLFILSKVFNDQFVGESNE